MAVAVGRNSTRNSETTKTNKVSKASNRSFRGFLKAVAIRDRLTLATEYKSEYVGGTTATVTKSVMSESGGAVGGYLVPREYSTKLLETLSEDSFIFPRANVIPMNSAEMQCPMIDVTTAPTVSGTSPFFGGVKFVWGNEQVATETEPNFRNMTLKAWDLLGYAVVSNSFLDDIREIKDVEGVGVANPGEEEAEEGEEPDSSGEEALIRLFGRAASWYAEYAFLQGLGSGSLMPMGVMNSPAVINIDRVNNGQIDNEDIANMIGSMLPFSWKHSIWACSPSCMDQLIKISNFFMNQASDQGKIEKAGGSGAIATRPLYVTEKLPSVGNRGDMILFDPSLYVIGHRREVVIDASTHVSFRTNQTNFRIWLRIDGRPQVNGTVTLQDTSTVVSPYIVLR